jgi:hypothetical protein
MMSFMHRPCKSTPNDDCLFPGHLDTQFGAVDKQVEGKCAIDSIVSHSRSGTDSVFEIKWKLGDKMWMPYYQVEHLNALPAYLELVGVEKVLGLPKGSGMPPNDPQMFVLSAKIFLQCCAYKGTSKPLPFPINNCTPSCSVPHHHPLSKLQHSLPNPLH